MPLTLKTIAAATQMEQSNYKLTRAATLLEESFEFTTRKDAMDGMNLSSTKLARGIKNGKILIGNIEYKFERKYFCFH